VKFSASLNFQPEGRIPFSSEKTIIVAVYPFEKFIDLAVQPSTFRMVVDSEKKFKCLIKPTEGSKKEDENEFS
jgi:hypothetical protein